MSEVTFAKTFLATLDKRPIKLAADSGGDARKYPVQSPFTLPKQTHPFPTRSGPTSTQQAKAQTITATLKPMRAGSAGTVVLPDITLDTSIHDLKALYATRSGQSIDKIKLLINRKPTADLKTLKDLGVKGDAEVSVMFIGGAAGGTATPVEKEAVPAAEVVPEAAQKMESAAPESEKAQAEADVAMKDAGAEGGEGILQTEEFWTDLKGFLAQRLRDQGEGERVAGVFRTAWERR